MPDLDRAHALEVIDVDGNALWDLVAATTAGLKLVATRTPEPGNVRQWRSSLLAKDIFEGLLPFDYANDGHDDHLSWSADGVKIVQSTPGGDVNRRQWTVLTPEFPTVNKIQAASCGDLDHDGDLDAVFASPAGVTAIMNEGGNRNHWVEVALQAQQIKGQQISPSGRVSPYGIGSLLELKAGARYQARVVRGQTTHFGLGQNAQAETSSCTIEETARSRRLAIWPGVAYPSNGMARGAMGIDVAHFRNSDERASQLATSRTR